ncbi:MAG: Maf family protein [Gemmatimonadaceae bacterium]|nr:Maf family protein [Gemmatimonadaceae bacterium]
MPDVILASASPRRRELLTRIGVAHVVAPADVDESVQPGERPAAYVERLARAKAAALAAKAPTRVIVAADTTVVLDDDILGKPTGPDDARAMLRRLVGRTHQVLTAVAVQRGAEVAAAVDVVDVRMRHVPESVIADYVATGEPLDKAGAYGIQGYGGVLVEGITGDFFAVMGLGLATTVRLLDAVGVPWGFRSPSPPDPRPTPGPAGSFP